MRRVLIVLVACALGACTTYDPTYEFEPAPASVRLGPDGSSGRVLATVLGVRSEHDGAPAAIDVRLRIEATPGHSAELRAEDLLLVASDMSELRASRAPPIAGGTAAGIGDVAFEFPQGEEADDHRLDGLSLRVGVTVDGRRESRTLTFGRVIDPFYLYPYPSYGYGYGFGWRRW